MIDSLPTLNSEDSECHTNTVVHHQAAPHPRPVLVELSLVAWQKGKAQSNIAAQGLAP